MEHQFCEVNSIRLHYVEEGAGPLVLLLHGFPDFWYSWREQLPALASAGYRAVAVDLRGYNQSARPEGIRAYGTEILAEDIGGLLVELGGEAHAVIGHDWGGVIGWHVAMHAPGRLRALVVLNAPHPATFRRALRRPSTQLLRSSYAAFFQLPILPEALLSAWDFALLKRALRSGPARTDEELERYLAALAAPEALTAALNYYRAALRSPSRRPVPTRVPALVLWGDRDPFLVPSLTHGLEAWVENLEVIRFPAAGHWLHLEQPDRVNEHLLAFLQTHQSGETVHPHRNP